MKRVLIVESETIPRLLYQSKFRAAGFEVIAVDNRTQALAILKEQKIDIVVIDLFSEKYRSMEIMEAMLAAKPEVPILPDTALHDFCKYFQEDREDMTCAFSSDLAALIDSAKRLAGTPSQS